MQTKQLEGEWVREDRRGLGWSIVDALIGIRETVARHLPRSARAAALVPSLLLVGSLVAGLALLLWSSLHTYDTFLAQTGGFSFAQYFDVVVDPQFQTVLVRTVGMALITALTACLIGLPYTLTVIRVRRRWLRLALLISMFVPMLTGDVTRTYGLVVALGPGGPLAWLSGLFGLEDPHLLGTLWAVGIGMVQTLLPVTVVILLPATLRLNPELPSAAMTMGARPTTVFLRITLPQLRNGIVAAYATSFALAMAAFADPAILGRGLLNFVSNFLQDRYLTLGNPPQGAAIGMLLIAAVSVGSALILMLGRAGKGSARK